MADGRFLSKDVAYDVQLNSVSLQADFLFTRMLPHLDREGRMPGNPRQVKALAVPMRDEFTPEVVERCLLELSDASLPGSDTPLVRWYMVRGRMCLEFPAFEKNQKGLRKDREKESDLPSPQDDGAVEVTAGLLEGSGPTPEDSGGLRRRPAEVEVQVEGEVEDTSSSTAREAEPAEDETGDEGPFDDLLPDAPHAVEVLERLQHKGTPRGTAATLRTSFLYDDPAAANPDPSVKGRDPPERRDLVVRALLEMQDQGVERWRARTLAGFIRRLSNGGNGGRADDSGAPGQSGGEAGESPFGDPGRRRGHSGSAA